MNMLRRGRLRADPGATDLDNLEPEVPSITPGSDSEKQEKKTITSKDIMTMVDRGEMDNKQAEMEFEKLEEKFIQKLTMRDIRDLVDTDELLLEQGEIELKNLEDKRNKNKTSTMAKMEQSIRT